MLHRSSSNRQMEENKLTTIRRKNSCKRCKKNYAKVVALKK